MNEIKNYKIMGSIPSTHTTNNKFKLLPYITKTQQLVSEFSGVVGEFSRIISNKKLTNEFDVESFLIEIVERIDSDGDKSSEETFKDIIKTMFIDNGRLIDFDINTINYIPSTDKESEIAKFLYSVLFDDSLKEDVKNHYEKDVENILHKLVLDSLPKLNNEVSLINQYYCYLPYVKKMFIKDFKFILSRDDLYKKSLKRVLEYYYLFYVSQLVMKLNEFDDADLTKPSHLYYTLDWECTSRTRTAYQFGWEKIKNHVKSLFPHAILLEMLNHSNLNEQLGYKELASIYNNIDEDLINKEINKLILEYKTQIYDVDWNSFKYKQRVKTSNGFDLVYQLYNMIQFQFEKSSKRKNAYKNYSQWFTKFVEINFAKRRGQLGYNLNITEDDIILMTKICINDNDKLKLNTLFEEFEARGLFFDRDSKLKIIELYEKLNLLEKKSDSGDAQYVKSVL